MALTFWLDFTAAVIYGCSAFFALQLAAWLYAGDEPIADGPAPMTVKAWIPIASAAAFGGFLTFRGATYSTLAVALIVIVALCATSWTDMTRGFIGDWFTLPPLALVLVLSVVQGSMIQVAVTVVVVTLPFAAGALLSRGRGLGWGDVKLVALGASLLDLQTSILVFALACFVACGVAFACGRWRQPIALGPYLAAGIALGMLLPPTRPLG